MGRICDPATSTSTAIGLARSLSGIEGLSIVNPD
jgi:hypothetical protein